MQVLISDWLKQSAHLLKDTSATQALDCEVLLADELGVDRAWLLAHGNEMLNSQQENRLRKKLVRRMLHEPIAYITGKSEFYGRTFQVSPDTLVPRPESETMIELLISHLSGLKAQSSMTIITDIGTGSGALAITAALELPQALNLKPKVSFYATDINEKCLEIAKQNAKVYDAKITFLHGDLIKPLVSHLPSPISHLLVMANLPYVPNSHTINEAAMWEPKSAIFGGLDGLDLYRRLFSQLSTLNYQLSTIFTESLPFQHENLRGIALQYGFTETTEDNFIQVFTNV